MLSGWDIAAIVAVLLYGFFFIPLILFVTILPLLILLIWIITILRKIEKGCASKVA